MSINHAQLVFNNDTFTRRHIFSFLPNECPHQVKRKNTLVKEFNKLNVYICQLYNNETQFYDLEPEYNNYNNHFCPSQYLLVVGVCEPPVAYLFSDCVFV